MAISYWLLPHPQIYTDKKIKMKLTSCCCFLISSILHMLFFIQQLIQNMNNLGSSALQQQNGQAQGRGGSHICQCLSRISSVRSNRDVTIYYGAREHHNGTGIIRRKTGFEFVKSVVSLAQGLFELGLRAGDVVAIAALNSDLYLEWLLAVAFVGGIAAPLNYRWSFEEAKSAMKTVNPVMLVFDESCHTWYTQLQQYRITSVRWHVFIGADLPHYSTATSLSISSCTTDNELSSTPVLTTEALKKPSQISPQFDYCWAPDGIALICFTSGTTGKPKGVAITHTALTVQSLAKIAIVSYAEDDVYLHTAPLCHIGGISSGMAMLMTGACHVLIPKFQPSSALKAIKQHQVSSLITVPTMLLDLISFIRSSSSRMVSLESTGAGGSVKKILNGGGGLSPQLIRDSALLFPNAKLISAYGMTETSSSLTFMTLYNPALEKSDSEPVQKSKSEPIHQGVCVGKPAPHVELGISVEGSSPIGSIITRGPHVMLKYWGQTVVSNQGWIDTGDIGWIDEHGELWLVGRSKDRIKSGGENVYPEEVESILSQHPGVSSILVVGIPDTRLSEMVVGCVRIKDNWQWDEGNSHSLPEGRELRLSSGILQSYCKQMNLSRFKIPKFFLLWSKPFPLTSTGKSRRNEVRKEAISHLQLLQSKL